MKINIVPLEKIEIDGKSIELGMKKETAIYIGDSEVDLATAKNAGIPCISVLWGFRDKELLEGYGADCFANTPTEVVKILEEELC